MVTRYVVLSIYEALNANMSPKLGFELPLPWNRYFLAKAGHFLQKMMASIIVLETPFWSRTLESYNLLSYRIFFLITDKCYVNKQIKKKNREKMIILYINCIQHDLQSML